MLRFGTGISTACPFLGWVLVAADEPQLRPVLLCLQDRRLPLPGQILKSAASDCRRAALLPPCYRAVAVW